MTEQEIQAMTKLVIENQDIEKEEFLKRKIKKTIDFMDDFKIDIMNQMHSFFIKNTEVECETTLEFASQEIDINQDSIEVLQEQINKLNTMLNTFKAENQFLIILHNELIEVQSS